MIPATEPVAEKPNLGSVSLFRDKNRQLAERARALLEAERPMTLRQLYYRLISEGTIDNKDVEYKRVGRVLTRLREDRQIPRTWLVDHVRATLKPSSWSGLADFGESVRDSYRKDFWASLPVHVEVFVEKDAVAGTIQPITREYDVALRVCRGYVSVSFAGEVADLWAQVTKPIHAYFLGDYDPSGFDLERDLREKLTRYSGREHVETDEADAHSFAWHRLGVRRADFQLHRLVCLPVKPLDKRAAQFRQQHGIDCAELDALPPTELRKRVEQAILSHIDMERWGRLQRTEELEMQTLERYMQAWRNGDEP